MTGLPLLCVRINQARQLAQGLRGEGLKPDVADALIARLKECARLLGESEGKRGASKSKPTRRRSLWRRSPLCFWCGVLTDVETANRPDSATVEHLYPRNHPRRRDARKYLPSTVLACAKCNHERGAPESRASEGCPVVAALARSSFFQF